MHLNPIQARWAFSFFYPYDESKNEEDLSEFDYLLCGEDPFHWLERGVLEAQCRCALRLLGVLFGKWCAWIVHAGKRARFPNALLEEEVGTAEDK